MAKFDLKFSNIVKVVLVILLVVGLYNLVYNSNVFNYSMYEGLDEIKNTVDNHNADPNDKDHPIVKNIKKTVSDAKKKLATDKLATDKDANAEGFAGLFTSNDDQSINCSLMQPYASYKCGPINPAKFFFDNIEFKPDCCPSTYSSSQGCACLCPQQINYLNSRGGNRTFPTEY